MTDTGGRILLLLTVLLAAPRVWAHETRPAPLSQVHFEQRLHAQLPLDLSKPGWWRAMGLYFVIGLIPIIGGIVARIVLPLVGLVMLFVDPKRGDSSATLYRTLPHRS